MKKQHTSLTVDPELIERSKPIMQKENRSWSNLVSVALKKYLDKYHGTHRRVKS